MAILRSCRVYAWTGLFFTMVVVCVRGLIVEFEPTIGDNDVVFQGENIFLKCGVIGAMHDETPTISFYRNNVKLFERTSTGDIRMENIGAKQEIQVRQFEVTLVFLPVEVRDAGNYTCTAAVQSVNATDQFTLRVETTWPQCVAKCEIGDLRYYCYAPYESNYAMLWEKSSNENNFTVFTDFQPLRRNTRLVGVSNNGSLDQGYNTTYRCLVTLYSFQQTCTFPNISDCTADGITSTVATGITSTFPTFPRTSNTTGNTTSPTIALGTDMTVSKTTSTLATGITSTSTVLLSGAPNITGNTTRSPDIDITGSKTMLPSSTYPSSSVIPNATALTDKNDSTEKLSTELFIGISLAALVMICILLIALVCFVRSISAKKSKVDNVTRRRSKRSERDGTVSTTSVALVPLSQYIAHDEEVVTENNVATNGQQVVLEGNYQHPNDLHNVAQEDSNGGDAQFDRTTSLTVPVMNIPDNSRDVTHVVDDDTYASIKNSEMNNSPAEQTTRSEPGLPEDQISEFRNLHNYGVDDGERLECDDNVYDSIKSIKDNGAVVAAEDVLAPGGSILTDSTGISSPIHESVNREEDTADYDSIKEPIIREMSTDFVQSDQDDIDPNPAHMMRSEAPIEKFNHTDLGFVSSPTDNNRYAGASNYGGDGNYAYVPRPTAAEQPNGLIPVVDHQYDEPPLSEPIGVRRDPMMDGTPDATDDSIYMMDSTDQSAIRDDDSNLAEGGSQGLDFQYDETASSLPVCDDVRDYINTPGTNGDHSLVDSSSSTQYVNGGNGEGDYASVGKIRRNKLADEIKSHEYDEPPFSSTVHYKGMDPSRNSELFDGMAHVSDGIVGSATGGDDYASIRAIRRKKNETENERNQYAEPSSSADRSDNTNPLHRNESPENTGQEVNPEEDGSNNPQDYDREVVYDPQYESADWDGEVKDENPYYVLEPDTP